MFAWGHKRKKNEERAGGVRCFRGWSLLCFLSLFVCVGCPAQIKKNVRIPTKPGQQVQVLEMRDAKKRLQPRTQNQTRSSHAYAYYMTGRIHALEQRHQKAIQAFKRAIVYDDKSAFLYFSIAKQFFLLDKLKFAITGLDAHSNKTNNTLLRITCWGKSTGNKKEPNKLSLLTKKPSNALLISCRRIWISIRRCERYVSRGEKDWLFFNA